MPDYTVKNLSDLPTASAIQPGDTLLAEQSGQAVKLAASLFKGDQGNAGPGVPSGGTTGQVLRKASATDYDGEWATVEWFGTLAQYNAIVTKDENTTYYILEETS